jgi:hypothetical protein
MMATVNPRLAGLAADVTRCPIPLPEELPTWVSFAVPAVPEPPVPAALGDDGSTESAVPRLRSEESPAEPDSSPALVSVEVVEDWVVEAAEPEPVPAPEPAPAPLPDCARAQEPERSAVTAAPAATHCFTSCFVMSSLPVR